MWLYTQQSYTVMRSTREFIQTKQPRGLATDIGQCFDLGTFWPQHWGPTLVWMQPVCYKCMVQLSLQLTQGWSLYPQTFALCICVVSNQREGIVLCCGSKWHLCSWRRWIFMYIDDTLGFVQCLFSRRIYICFLTTVAVWVGWDILVLLVRFACLFA